MEEGQDERERKIVIEKEIQRKREFPERNRKKQGFRLIYFVKHPEFAQSSFLGRHSVNHVEHPGKLTAKIKII